MKNLVSDFRKARDSLVQVVSSSPKEKRELILFDKWSLKDLLSHLSGWAEYQAKTLRQLKRGNEIKILRNLKASINEDFVSQRKEWSWNKVFQEFSRLSGGLIKEYESLPKKLWKEKVYEDREITIDDFIRIEINHYNKTHGPQVKKVLGNL